MFLTCSSQNELAVYELVHNFVEVLDKYFSRVVRETESSSGSRDHLTFFYPSVRRANWTYPCTTAVTSLLNFLCAFAPLTQAHQIMFNLDRVHIILDEMIQNGQVVETNKSRILAPLAALDKMADG